MQWIQSMRRIWLRGWWNKKKNVELIAVAQQLLEQVRRSSAVTFAHVRAHAGVEGNERADRLVQWGKTEGPYSRLSLGGDWEGNGRSGRVVGRSGRGGQLRWSLCWTMEKKTRW
eukprot:SAG11_NODE_975_length_6331_cov_4.407895_4_plen_114_part_00